MKRAHLSGGTLLGLLVSFGPFETQAAAQEASQAKLPRHVRTLEPGGKPALARIGDVAWIAGHWLGQAMGGVSEEIWSPPRAGTMMGVFRQIGDEGVEFFEILTLVEHEGSLVLRLKHFGPDLKGWEEKDESREFMLVALEEKAAFFDGMTFRRNEDGGLTVWVLVRQKDGSVTELEFPFRSAESPARGARTESGPAEPEAKGTRILLTRVPGRIGVGEAFRCAGEIALGDGMELAAPAELIVTRDGLPVETYVVREVPSGATGTRSFEVEIKGPEQTGSYTLTPTLRVRRRASTGSGELITGDSIDFNVSS